MAPLRSLMGRVHSLATRVVPSLLALASLGLPLLTMPLPAQATPGVADVEGRGPGNGQGKVEGALWLALSDDKLAAMRGGFSTGVGVMVSFGILRTVHINGVLASSSGFQVADLRSITPMQAEQLSRQTTAVSLVQSGPGNAFTTPFAAGVPGVVVQNTLSEQKIRSVTEINAASNGMSMLKGLNLNQTLNDALAGSR